MQQIESHLEFLKKNPDQKDQHKTNLKIFDTLMLLNSKKKELNIYTYLLKKLNETINEEDLEEAHEIE